MKKKKKKIYLVHSLRGLREKLKYRLNSGEGSKVLGFQVVATIREYEVSLPERSAAFDSRVKLALIITVLMQEPSQCST